MTNLIKFTVSRGLRGFYAMAYDAVTGEPIQTGYGSYDNSKDAAIEAREWAISENHLAEASRLTKLYNLSPLVLD